MENPWGLVWITNFYLNYDQYAGKLHIWYSDRHIAIFYYVFIEYKKMDKNISRFK